MTEPKINVDLGASARLEIKAEVPPTSVGRLVDALTDLIRPLSEARGLRGDEIRLQREEVAIEIAKKTLQLKALESEEPIVPVSNKVLVPLLEKASLEDIGDETMIERWAELLSAAATQRSIPARFVSLLAEIDGEQAKLLEAIYFGAGPEAMDCAKAIVRKPLDGVAYDVDHVELKKVVLAATATSTPFDTFLASMNVALSGPGLMLGTVHLASEDRDPDRAARIPRQDPSYTRNLDVLKSLSLIDQKRFDYELGLYALSLVYFQITDLGIGLLAACSHRARQDVAARTKADSRRGKPKVED